MAAAVIPVLAPQPNGMPSRTARPRLRLVGPDERLGPDERFGLDGWVGQPDSCPAPPGVRLTRRGRLALTVLATVAVVAVAIVLAASVDAAAPRIDHATTVSAGQTLSEVAAAQLPSLPIRDAVARIQLVNGMNTSQVQAGQSLLIPQLP